MTSAADYLAWALAVAFQIGFVLFLLWQMWLGFVAVMHLRKVRDRYGLTHVHKVLGGLALLVYGLLDIGLRCTVFLLMDHRVQIDWKQIGPLSIPVPETVSAMLERHAKTGDGWRRSLATWIREDWLADFDPSGSHGTPGRD